MSHRELKPRHTTRPTKVIIGMGIMAFGVLLLLDRLNISEVKAVWRIWPVFLLALGASKLAETWNTPEIGSGGWLVMMGTWFLAVNFHLFGLTYQNGWPLLIIAVGLSMVARALVPLVFPRNGGPASQGPDGSGWSSSGTEAPTSGIRPEVHDAN